jgi:hypothetical protein
MLTGTRSALPFIQRLDGASLVVVAVQVDDAGVPGGAHCAASAGGDVGALGGPGAADPVSPLVPILAAAWTDAVTARPEFPLLKGF